MPKKTVNNIFFLNFRFPCHSPSTWATILPWDPCSRVHLLLHLIKFNTNLRPTLRCNPRANSSSRSGRTTVTPTYQEGQGDGQYPLSIHPTSTISISSMDPRLQGLSTSILPGTIAAFQFHLSRCIRSRTFKLVRIISSIPENLWDEVSTIRNLHQDSLPTTSWPGP